MVTFRQREDKDNVRRIIFKMTIIMKDNKPLEVFLLNVSALPVYFLFVEISSYICLFLNNSCDTFLQELKKYGVTTVVRVCEATYDATLVVKEGIQVLVSSGLQNLHDHQCIEPNSM